MALLAQLERWFERLLEFVVMSLTSGLTIVVLLAVIYRKAGHSFVWYDEVATILLQEGPDQRRVGEVVIDQKDLESLA